jgi:hypothetical protein
VVTPSALPPMTAVTVRATCSRTCSPWLANASRKLRLRLTPGRPTRTASAARPTRNTALPGQVQQLLADRHVAAHREHVAASRAHGVRNGVRPGESA